MKTCPYCEKEILDGVTICNHCGRDLVVKEPATLTSLVFMVLLLVAVYGIAFLIGSNYTGSDLLSVLRNYQFISSIVITFLAVSGLDPNKRGFWRYVGIFILSVIPIAGWVVLYWAGKGIARSFTQGTPAVESRQAITPTIEPMQVEEKSGSALTITLWVIGGLVLVAILSNLSGSASTPPPTRTRTPFPTRTPNRIQPSATPKPISIKACVTNSTINVRRGPGKEFEAVGGLVSGTCMQILGRNEDSSWVYMQAEDFSTGWVSASLLTIEGNVSRVPVRTNPGVALIRPTATRLPSNASNPLLNAFAPTATKQGFIFHSDRSLCSQTADRVGESVSCRIEQASCDYRPDVDGSPTFCNDRPYPNQNFQLVVFGADWSDYDGLCIIVSGTVELYRGVPQIQGFSRSQISYCQ